ncbi:MAG: molybdenum cofactor guanylyltransferase [Sporomusaceae bacterium]|nr:molybdenum cofactor guanylyltransferase [Sporomusaceae bacterium]
MHKELAGIAPVILAGGKSSRMGRNKSFITLGDKKLIDIIAEKVAALFSLPPLLVTNTPKEYAYLGLPAVSDLYRDMGPLGGIHAALKQWPAKRIFVFGCDMPFISPELVRHMAALAPGFDVVMPQFGERPEPLHTIYSAACLAPAEACLARGDRRVISFFPQVNVRYLQETEIRALLPDDTAFININTPEDLERAQELVK